MTTQWRVELLGAKMDLEELPEWLSGPELEVTTLEGRYFLSGTAFESFSNASDVADFATDIIERVNALGPLLWSGYEPVRTGAILSEDGTHHVIAGTAAGRARVKGRGVVVKVDGTEAPGVDPAFSVLHVLTVSTTDPLVDRVLRYLQPPHITWSDLYRALEAVEEDVGEISRAGWAPEGRRRLFRHTANSFGALGLDARHGHSTTSPPQQLMTFEQAKSLVYGVVTEWLKTK